MDYKILKKINSLDDDERIIATNEITKCFEDLDYISTLFRFLEESIAENDFKALQTTFIVITKFLKNNFKRFSSDDYIFIVKKLFKDVENIPFDYFRYIFHIYNFIYSNFQLFDILLDDIHRVLINTESRDQRCFCLKFIYCFLQKDINMETLVLCRKFVDDATSDLGNIVNQEIIVNSLNIFCFLSLNNIGLFRSNETQFFLDFIINIINSNAPIEGLKKHIYGKITEKLLSCYGHPDRILMEKREFSEYFRENFCSLLFHNCVNILPNQHLNESVIECVYNLLSNEIFPSFLNEELLLRVLFYPSVLNREDISIYDEIPMQYLSFYVYYDEEDVPTRQKIIKILAILSKYNNILHSILLKIVDRYFIPSGDVYEVEAFIFIIGRIANYIKVEDCVIELLLRLSSGNYSNFIQLSILFSIYYSLKCYKTFAKENMRNSIIALGFTAFIGHNDLLIKFAGMKIIKSLYDHKQYRLDQSVDISLLLSKLLELSCSLKSRDVQSFITDIISVYPDRVLPVANEVLETMLHMVEESKFDIDNNSVCEILTSISNLFITLDKNTFSGISSSICSTVYRWFTDLSSLNCEVHLFSILYSLACSMDAVDPLIFDSLKIVKHFLESEQAYEIIIDSKDIIYFLTSKTEFYRMELHKNLLDIVFTIFRITDFENITSICLNLVTSMLQHSNSLIEMVDHSLPFLNPDVAKDKPSVFYDAIKLLVTGIIIDESVIDRVLSDDIIKLWFEMCHSMRKVDEIIVKYNLIGVITVSSVKNLASGVELVKYLYTLYCNICEDMTYYDYSYDNESIDIVKFDKSLPFDNFDVNHLYNSFINLFDSTQLCCESIQSQSSKISECA